MTAIWLIHIETSASIDDLCHDLLTGTEASAETH